MATAGSLPTVPLVSPPATQSAFPADKYYTIISLCGGGFRGLLSARLLANIDHWLTGTGVSLVKQAGLIAGTSTGAGITGLLTNPIKAHTPAEVVDYFLTDEAYFFRHPLTGPPVPPLPEPGHVGHRA